jgi:hypothetical protein
MKWIKKPIQTYFDVYYCSNCLTEIMVTDSIELPCYCKACEQDEEED